jgi:putative protease
MMETMIGKVIHYYPKIGVAAVILEDHIANGDRIHIRGPHDDVHQPVTSMEIEHIPIKEADKGQDVGIKVIERVHEVDAVFREI